jgi:hypothetical protein
LTTKVGRRKRAHNSSLILHLKPSLNMTECIQYDPAIPLLGIYMKKCESGYNKGTCTSMFIAALFTVAKLLK